MSRHFRKRELLPLIGIGMLIGGILAGAGIACKRYRRATESHWVCLPIASGGLICQNVRYWRNGRCYVDERVYRSLRNAARKMRREFPGSRVAYMDGSGARRGKLMKHRSHGDGLNVDIQYLAKDADGSHYPVRPLWQQTGYVMNYSRDQRCGGLRFDAERNWRFLMALRAKSLLPVQTIFVEGYIRTWLLEEGRRQKASQEELAWATARLAPAGTSGAADHKDHFHIRFGLPLG